MKTQYPMKKPPRISQRQISLIGAAVVGAIGVGMAVASAETNLAQSNHSAYISCLAGTPSGCHEVNRASLKPEEKQRLDNYQARQVKELEGTAAAVKPARDGMALTRACVDDVRSAQIGWFVRVTGMPAPSGTAATELRSILSAQGFDLSQLEPMPTRDCASLQDGPEKPVEQWLLNDTNRVQMPIPSEG